ncbi:hypothetical protein SAMN02799624_00752 [Paenibacillus sp. UNC496MF]|uniref:hypothetical protein n=1 Tax=Paenibacillus sp. UNC496MF TaxID=1502753 RepID=UPI0008EB208C|nr:hypothetical protein [Paenibacillus sp. UNC496MF]SFI38783.1 hypothetical protein SAMN02799624_00752 [Paenibacillus sp. UNC496MF]
MAIISTGPIDNSPTAGLGISQQAAIHLANRSASGSATVLIQGYHLTGSRTLYVLEQIVLAPNEHAVKRFFSGLAAFEFVLDVSGPGQAGVEAALMGVSASGAIVAAVRMAAAEGLRR